MIHEDVISPHCRYVSLRRYAHRKMVEETGVDIQVNRELLEKINELAGTA